MSEDTPVKLHYHSVSATECWIHAEYYRDGRYEHHAFASTVACEHEGRLLADPEVNAAEVCLRWNAHKQLLAACEAALSIAANCKRLEDATWAAKHQNYRTETPRMAQHRKAIEGANSQLRAAIAAAKGES